MPLLKWFVIVSCCILLSGCLEKSIVDDINIESVEGFDLIEGDVVMGTVLAPIYRADQTISNETFSSVANLNKDLLRELQKESSAPLVNGSLEVVLFNRDLAEQGIIKLVDALERDSSIGTGLYFAIVEGQVKSLLEQDYGNEGTGNYLLNLLKHNIDRRDIPATNMHIFLSDYYQKGKDPNLPIIKVEGNKVAIEGVGVLKEAKLADIIPNTELFYFKLLVDNHTNGSMAIKIPKKEEYVSMQSIKTKRKLRMEWNNGQPHFFITLKVDGVILEYSGKKVDEKKIEEFQKHFEEDITNKSLALIQSFQKSRIDPIGFGYEAKSRKRGFDMKKWEEQYPNVKIDVSTEVRIIGTGITE